MGGKTRDRTNVHTLSFRMRWSQKRQKTQTATSGNDLLLLQKIRALENVLSEAQSLLVDVRGLLAESEAKDQKKRQQHQVIDNPNPKL